jgi:hypothetical protein
MARAGSHRDSVMSESVTVDQVTDAIKNAIPTETLLVEDVSGGCGAKFSLVCYFAVCLLRYYFLIARPSFPARLKERSFWRDKEVGV